MPRTNEIAFNVALSNVLRTKHPRWRDRTGAEQQGVVRETAQRPDIVIRPPGGIPVVLETEFEPARSVEEDARKRLGQFLRLKYPYTVCQGPNVGGSIGHGQPVLAR